MKFCKGLLLAIMLFIGLSDTAMAQPELGRSRYLKNVSEARNRALTNTILPIVTGITAANVFENNTVQTLGSALAIYGLVMGPSGGNFYAEDYLRGGLGVAARAGIGYFMLLDATRELMGKEVATSMTWDNKEVKLTDTKILIGAGAFLGTIVYNILSSKASVKEYNSSRGYQVEMRGEQVGQNVYPALSARVYF
ncbi:MAG: hypothetical protein R3222_09285 [Balneolaceae bacterium]|nr:hypothetical protein [Balneolaceae bacterium]